MSEETQTAQVEENGKSTFAVTIHVSGHELLGDEPVSKGGANDGPSPYDFLLAALGECTAMAVRWYAQQQNWPLEKVGVRLSYRKDMIEGQTRKTDIFEKKIILRGDTLSDEQRKKLIERAAKCSVQRTLEGTSLIKTIS